MSHKKILIVGGGIGGITAATALANVGFSVTLMEAAAAFGEVGAGVTLSPNAVKGLAHIGLSEQVAAAGVEPERQRVQSWEDGRTLVEMSRADCRERYGAPYVYIHRADLHALLVDAARTAGVDLITSARVVDVREDGVLTSSGDFISGDIIVGADGLKSKIRELFDPSKPSFTGHVAWRALVPANGRLRELAEWPGIHIGPERMVRGGSVCLNSDWQRISGLSAGCFLKMPMWVSCREGVPQPFPAMFPPGNICPCHDTILLLAQTAES